MAESGHRTVPMKVISFGLCRTGTQSKRARTTPPMQGLTRSALAIADTLELLGFGTIYHQREVIKRGHESFWTAAQNAQNAGDVTKTPTRADFDAVLGTFQGAVDLPSALQVNELLDAYPEAQILLTSRDPDKWVASVNSTIMHARTIHPASPSTQAWRDAVDFNWNYDFDRYGRSFFLIHNQRVRDELARRRRPLLELDVSDPSSLDRLCEYLDVSKPASLSEFPKSDEWQVYKKDYATNSDDLADE